MNLSNICMCPEGHSIVIERSLGIKDKGNFQTNYEEGVYCPQCEKTYGVSQLAEREII